MALLDSSHSHGGRHEGLDQDRRGDLEIHCSCLCGSLVCLLVQRKESIENETYFCDPEVLRGILSAKVLFIYIASLYRFFRWTIKIFFIFIVGFSVTS